MGGGGTYIDTLVTQYSAEPMLSGPGVWWWTNKASLLCRGTYDVVYIPRHVDDHGDTIETATAVTLDTFVSGTINPANDADYFSIEIDTQTDVNIFTTRNLDTIGTLYDGTNTFLQDDDDSGEGLNFLISRRLDDPGTYYIEVGSFGSSSIGIGNYTLHVFTDDHSPTTNRATILSLNTTVSGTIEREGNVDYFSLEIDASTDVNIFTTGNLDTVGTLYDRTVTSLQDDDNSGEGNNFLISARLDPGTYFIEVRSSGTETGDYVLHVEAVDVDDPVPQISLIIPSTLTESTNKPDGFTMINVKHGEPFPVYISVTNAVDSLQLTLEGPARWGLAADINDICFRCKINLVRVICGEQHNNGRRTTKLPLLLGGNTKLFFHYFS